MNYRDFVKENFHNLPADMKAKEKMKKIGEMWREQTGKSPMPKKMKGGRVIGGSITGRGGRGGNFFSENILPAMSFGLLGGDVKPNKMEGKGIFSDVLSSFGLGMEPKILHKHHNRMMMLERKLHESGKLTPSEHHKLKVYHHLHGAGFFDSLFGGIKKGVSAVVNNLDSIKKVVPEIIKVIPTGVKNRAMGLIPGGLGTMVRAANTLASV